MPFDSSKVEYHDKMDMFFRTKESMKAMLEPSGKPKHSKCTDVNGKHGDCKTTQKEPKANDYIDAYERKK